MVVLTLRGGQSYAETVDRGDARPLTPIEHARRIAELAQEKLAADVVILDMRPVCSYTDFFVVCTGQNPRQTKAIFDEVYARLKQDDTILPRSVAGEREATWIVADYLDLVPPEVARLVVARRLYHEGC